MTKTTISKALLAVTCIISTTFASMATYKDKTVYSDENDGKVSYNNIRMMNGLTGEFFEFSQDNLLLKSANSSDYADEDTAERWYRKMMVTNSKSNEIELGLSNNSEQFKREDLVQDADPFSARVMWEGRIKSDEQTKVLIYLIMHYGDHPLSFAYGDGEFMTFFVDPRNRMNFYIRLLALLKRLIEKLDRRLCTFAPTAIGLVKRASKEDGSLQYYPVIREFYNAVKLNQDCKTYQMAYSPSSIILGPLETESKMMERVEMFSIGMIIYYMETHFAFGAYQNYDAASPIPDWVAGLKPSDEFKEMMTKAGDTFSLRDLFTKANQTETAYKKLDETTGQTYSNKALKNNLRFLRQTCGKFLEANPFVTEAQDVTYTNCMGMNSTIDANKYLLEVYNNFFEFVDSMTNQNNTTLYQRPTYDQGIAKITEFLGQFKDILGQVPKKNVVWYQERLLI